MSLYRCGVATQLARERESPAGRDGAQRVHALPWATGGLEHRPN
jgi:hypothetical protein